MSNQPLFVPYRMGDLGLPNRIVMAPLTRMRAQSHDHVPTALQAEYYAQRASAGLIIAEATAISPEGFGWADTPGLWTEQQVRGWRRVTDAVHAAGGRMIAQLWHTGAISHPELLDGAQPVSASNVDPGQISVAPTGRKPTVTPRPLTKQEIQITVADFARAARNAMEAGFDGVQTVVAESAHRATVLARGNHGVVNGWIGFELFFGIVSVPVPPCSSDDDVSLRVGPISFRIREVGGPGVGWGCGIVPRPSISLPNRQGGKHEVLLAHHLVAILSGRDRIVRNRGETNAVLGK